MEDALQSSKTRSTEPSSTSDFNVFKQESSRYKFIPVAPTGGSSATITSVSPTVTFNIGGGQEVLNLSRSRLNFTFAIPATNAKALISNHMNSPISKIKISTSGGQVLLDIDYLDRMQQMVLPYTMDMDTYLTQPSGDLGTGGTNRDAISSIAPSNGNIVPGGAITSSGGQSKVRALRWDTGATGLIPSTAAERAYTGPRYTIGIPRGARAQSIAYSIPLGESYPYTILAMDKSIYVGNERLILDITFAPNTRIYCSKTVATNSGVATNWGTAATSTLAAASDITVSSINLQVAYEDNRAISDSVKALFLKGLTFPIDYPHQMRLSNSGTSQNITLGLHSGMGSHVKYIWWAAYNATESANTAWNHSNVSGSKITSYQTFMNGQPLQLSALSSATKDDWKYLQPYYSGKPAAQTFDTFRYNFTHLDSFVDPDSKITEDTGSVTGRSIANNDVQYSVVATCPSATLNWYVFTVTTRTLSARNGILSIK